MKKVVVLGDLSTATKFVKDLKSIVGFNKHQLNKVSIDNEEVELKILHPNNSESHDYKETDAVIMVTSTDHPTNKYVAQLLNNFPDDVLIDHYDKDIDHDKHPSVFMSEMLMTLNDLQSKVKKANTSMMRSMNQFFKNGLAFFGLKKSPIDNENEIELKEFKTFNPHH